MRVFVVWEPILKTDFMAPITPVLGRASDARVRQYWDVDRLVAKQMKADARPPQPEQDCCLHTGILWDLVAVYPKGARWDDRMPVATIFNGSVVDMADAMDTALQADQVKP